MIAHLTGTIASKSPTEVILDVHGVGFQLNVPLSTFEALASAEGEVTLLTHLVVREDAMQLFAFATEPERALFRMLIAVSGIGPKMAQSILSGLPPAHFREAVITGNVSALTAISGVGKKTAERLVIELRDKLSKSESTDMQMGVPATSHQGKARAEAIVALMSLGYARQAAEKALRAVLNESVERDLSVEELIKRSLRHATRG